MTDRTKERNWLEAELHGFLKDMASPGAGTHGGATLEQCYIWFMGPDGNARWKGSGPWGRIYTYSRKRKKAMIREELKRLVAHGKVVKVGVRTKKEPWWKGSSTSRTAVTVYRAVGLLDAMAHAAKGPKRPMSLARAV